MSNTFATAYGLFLIIGSAWMVIEVLNVIARFVLASDTRDVV